MPSDDASQGQDCILPDDVFRSERRAHVDAVALSQTSDLECAPVMQRVPTWNLEEMILWTYGITTLA